MCVGDERFKRPGGADLVALLQSERRDRGVRAVFARRVRNQRRGLFEIGDRRIRVGAGERLARGHLRGEAVGILVRDRLHLIGRQVFLGQLLGRLQRAAQSRIPFLQ